MVGPNICGSSVWNLLNIAILVPRILMRLLDFWKICTPAVEYGFEIILVAVSWTAVAE
jgi:hypothetical protein